MSIYKPFKPTYLYIKQHTITGKLYFGKTCAKFKTVEQYKGSGTQWVNHIKYYGKEHVITLWYDLFDNIFDLVAFAISFSNKLNIVKSDQWLNKKIETGLDGGGAEFWTEEQKNNVRGKNSHNYGKPGTRLGAIENAETRKKKSISHAGVKLSASHSAAISKSLKGKPKLKNICCPHCSKRIDAGNAKRWHFDNCKNLFND